MLDAGYPGLTMTIQCPRRIIPSYRNQCWLEVKQGNGTNVMYGNATDPVTEEDLKNDVQDDNDQP